MSAVTFSHIGTTVRNLEQHMKLIDELAPSAGAYV